MVLKRLLCSRGQQLFQLFFQPKSESLLKFVTRTEAPLSTLPVHRYFKVIERLKDVLLKTQMVVLEIKALVFMELKQVLPSLQSCLSITRGEVEGRKCSRAIESG